jgi:hypothetical protein
MSELLQVDTAVTVTVGPFMDLIYGVIPETGLAGSMIVYLAKNGGSFAVRDSSGTITHDKDGFYLVPLNVNDVDTLGRLQLEVTATETHLSVWEKYRVIEENPNG